MEEKRIKGSPFPAIVKLPIQKLGTPIKTINDLKGPLGVAINQRGEIIVSERDSSCVSIFTPTGEKLRSFCFKGSAHGWFNYPWGLAVDDDGYYIN